MRIGRPGLWGDMSRAHPLVREIFRICLEQRASILDVQERAGFNQHTLRRWRTISEPRVSSLEAVANVLGYRLALVPIEEDRRRGPDGRYVADPLLQISIDHAPDTHDLHAVPGRKADSIGRVQQEERRP